jgi:hypothetical protein
MSFYIFSANTTPDLPVGTKYRVLSTRDDLLDGNWIMQVEGACSLTPATESQIAILGDITGCITEWVTAQAPEVLDTPAEPDVTIQQLDAIINSLDSIDKRLSTKL